MTRAICFVTTLALLAGGAVAATEPGTNRAPAEGENLPLRPPPGGLKDPLMAGVLSWYGGGLGQIYAGKPIKGVAFWLIENTLAVSTFLTVANVGYSMGENQYFTLVFTAKEDLSDTQRYGAIALGVAFACFHIYNVYDAVQTARIYNFELRESQPQEQPALAPAPERRTPRIALAPIALPRGAGLGLAVRY